MTELLTAADVRRHLGRSEATPAATPAGLTVAHVRAQMRGFPAAGAPTETKSIDVDSAPAQVTDPVTAPPAPAAGSSTAADLPAAVEDSRTRALPDDMPGRGPLTAAGVHTYADLIDVDDLTAISGIGRSTAEKIEEWIQANA